MVLDGVDSSSLTAEPSDSSMSGESTATGDGSDAATSSDGSSDEPPLPARPDEQYCSFVASPSSRIGHVFPRELSRSGCFLSLDPIVPAPDLVPFAVNSQLWTDGAHKDRWVVLPVGAAIEIREDGSWWYPDNAVIIKNFSYVAADDPDGHMRPVETRVMVKRAMTWEFYSYRWREDGRDAELLDGGHTDLLSVVLDEQVVEFEYTYPTREHCAVCHRTEDQVFGPLRNQLDRVVDYGHVQAPQLDAWASIGMFDASLPAPGPHDRALVDALDTTATLEDRARSYLHVNCSHCHRPGGWVPPGMHMDLRYGLPLADARVCDEPLQYVDVWTPADYRIKAGAPEASSVWLRSQLRNTGQMPPLGTALRDPGSAVVREWIESLAETGCPQ